MKQYMNLDGDSGVVGYETGADFIRVQFKDRSVYLYTYASAGNYNIERMKSLAEAGEGLNSFIMIHARKKYARKEA
jgi:hypothetical protein